MEMGSGWWDFDEIEEDDEMGRGGGIGGCSGIEDGRNLVVGVLNGGCGWLDCEEEEYGCRILRKMEEVMEGEGSGGVDGGDWS